MRYLLPILFLAFPMLLNSQTEDALPSYLTKEERALMPFYQPPAPGARSLETDPPDFTPRTMAEWEEIQSLTVTWTAWKSIVAQIIFHAKEEVEVIVVCSDSSEVKWELENIYDFDDLDNISFVEDEYDSIWIRDYGANTIYANDVDSLYLVDWIYNRPRPDDDLIPEAIADFKGLTLFSTTEAPNDLVHTGGNFTSDGMGTGFSSNLILGENGPFGNFNVTVKDEDDIDAIMNAYMGISRYIKMEELPFDVISHIDMHMRLLDEETILLGQFPEGVSDGPQIEANLQYVLSNYQSAFGTPYRIVRIDMPPSPPGNYPPNAHYRTYTNSVLVNKTILVPTYYQAFFNEEALQIYRENMPGYKVVGINCEDMISASGALHCITRAIGVNDPLWIVHQRLRDAYDVFDDFEVNATIKHRSGISEATLFYTTDTLAGYSSTPMTLTDPATDTWTGYIPNDNSSPEYFYYIGAESNSGKTQVRPLTAPAGYYNFKSFITTSQDEVVSNTSGMDPIFPNPASAITCIPVTSSVAQNARIEVVDAYGRVIEVLFEGTLPAGESKHFLMAHEYVSGTYFVQLHTENGIHTQRVVVK
jgi:agmatine deiminase